MINKPLIFLFIILNFFLGRYLLAQQDEVLSLVKENTEINSLCFSKGGSQIVFNKGNKIIYENLNDKSQISTIIGGHNKKILSLDLSNDSSKIVSGGQDSLIILWDSKGKIIKKLNYHKGIVTTVRFDPTGSYIYSGSTDRRLVCYNINKDSIIFDVEVFKDDILSIDISSNGRLLASGGANGESYVFDTKNGQIIRSLKIEEWIRCVRFNSNSSMLAICCDNGAIYFWSTVNHMDIRLLTKHKLSDGWITSMDFFPDNESFSYSTEIGIIGISILGNVDRFRVKAPVLMIRNQPSNNNFIKIAVATFGKGIKLISGSSIMNPKY
jgi:WD40 repeat protein